MTGLGTIARAYWAPKSTGVRAEWEDWFAYSEPANVFAVADGATWATESRRWAKELTGGFVRSAIGGRALDRASIPGWLDDARSGFAERGQAPSGSAAPADGWWSEDAAARGAAAAFVGLRMDPASARWTAVAVGDCCLFHFSSAGSVSFPLDRSDAFTSSPVLATTVATVALDDVFETHGHLAPGDLFVLASDAISSWIVSEIEIGRSPAALLAAVRSSNFGRFVDELRRRDLMPDDDVTLMRVHVVEATSHV